MKYEEFERRVLLIAEVTVKAAIKGNHSVEAVNIEDYIRQLWRDVSLPKGKEV